MDGSEEKPAPTGRYEVCVERGVLKWLTALRDRTLRLRLEKAIDALAVTPRPSGCTKLAGAAGRYRIRVGDYRIIYEVRDRVLLVLVLDAGHRRDIYRN